VQCNRPDPFDCNAATIDHIVPFVLGGDHSRANVQTLCLSCNSSKSDTVANTAA
jgi:5-methylcytosine-specific restriction endonuclease McrA